MSTYMIPITTAIITFPFFALLFTLPFLIYQYRKHGYINYYRAFILYSFLLYLLAAYYLIILPLPKTRDILSMQKPGTRYTQLIPFKFIYDIITETKVNLLKPSTYLHIIKERAFYQAAFNAILLCPLGIYLSYYFKRSLKKAILISFLVSLFFELTQLSGLYGFYNRPYRVFDVDDLMLNTLGGFIGYKISILFKMFLPNVNKLDDKIILNEIPVGFIRRILALCIDWFIFALISALTNNHFKSYIFVFIYFMLIPYITNGKTFGKWLLRIKIVGKEEKIKFTELLLRYGIFYYGFFGLNYLLLFMSSYNKIQFKGFYFLYLVQAIIDFIVGIHLMIHFFSKNKILFHDKFSKTKQVVFK